MTYKMKFNYNSFVEHVLETIASENIEEIQENAWNIALGFDLLGRYLKEIAEHTIETEDPWLTEWCKNLLIIKEAEEGE